MSAVTGSLGKMPARLESPVEYSLPLGEETVPLNPLLGTAIRLRHTGRIHCVACGRVTRKSFNQGHCYPCFKRLASCDGCIVSPEKCHHHLGTCREPQWGLDHCMQPHVVYLANSSGLKVGITRGSQVPTRWIDQGASQALPVYRVGTRRDSGLIESALKGAVADRTDWRKMLRGEPEPLDLKAERERLGEYFDNALDALDEGERTACEPLADAEPIAIEYPVLEYPGKVRSLNLEKTPEVEGTLLGIKGQYLILDTGVMNVRRHGGFEVELDV